MPLDARDLADAQAALAAELPSALTTTATLLEIRGPGTIDDWGEVADPTTGATLWSGSAAANLRRTQLPTARAGHEGGPIVREVDELRVFRFQAPAAATLPTLLTEPDVDYTVLFDDLRTGAAVRRRARVLAAFTEGDGALADKVVFQLDNERGG